MSFKTTARRYYYLTKPGIIYGNCMSAAAGFLLAAQGNIEWLLFAALLVGMALVIASGCVVNNYIDRGIDSKMDRTHKRALVTGRISGREALLYAGILCVTGFTILIAYTNWLTAVAGLIGLVFYVVVYGIAKRLTVWGTVIGSISGAVPITAGYLAVSDELDTGALLLFLIMACWQMPHFYAIAMYRLDDYKAAGIPVLPAVRGIRHAKLKIMAYVVGFAAACTALTLTGYTGVIFLTVMLSISAVWFWKGYIGYKTNTDFAWAKRMFHFSLIVLLVFSFLLSFDWLLP